MEIVTTVLSILLSILGILWSIVWWFLSFLFTPLLILAVIGVIGLRYAYRTPILKPYVERLFAGLTDKGYFWLRQLLYLISVEPFRVLMRFMWFSIVYAVVNLWWQPRWSPWQRAKERPERSRPVQKTRKKSARKPATKDKNDSTKMSLWSTRS